MMRCSVQTRVVVVVITVFGLLAYGLLFYLLKTGVSDLLSGRNSTRSSVEAGQTTRSSIEAGQTTRSSVEAGQTTRPCVEAGQTTRQPVLLITYTRSGSSFTSAIISRHPDVFFVSEPLFYLDETNRDKNKDPYFVNTFENQSRRIIQTFLTCEFTPDDVYVWDNRQMINSEDTQAFFRAFRQNDHLKVLVEYVRCLQECKCRRYTLVKTIRFQVRWAEWFLQHMPNFKVIYLVRDPRASLYSQSQLFQSFDWTKGIDAMSKLQCRVLGDDLQHLERLARLYPRQIMGIRYEDLAEKPIDYARRLYEYLGLEMNDTVLEYVRNMTEANGTKSGSVAFTYGVMKTQSSDIMKFWRSVAEYSATATVDRNCGHLYGKLGYRPLKSERHLRSRDPLHGEPGARGVFERGASQSNSGGKRV